MDWLESFPQYNDRDFYIMGEIYADHYVLELVVIIITNKKHINHTNINLEGIVLSCHDLNSLAQFIGLSSNWVLMFFLDRLEMDISIWFLNLKAMIDYFWTHALISDETYEVILSTCNFTRENFSEECTFLWYLSTWRLEI